MRNSIVSKEEYVKEHMKMSSGVKFACVMGVIALGAGILLLINLYPRIEELIESFMEWVELVSKYDENAGKYGFKFFLLFICIVTANGVGLYIAFQRKKLEDHYIGYCEFKERERRHAKPEIDEWKCPKCGKINQNYVGTCGCGQLKP